MSADSKMWEDDAIVNRHKQIIYGLSILARAEKRANRVAPSEYRRQNVIDALFDTAIDEVRRAPDAQVGLGDSPIPTKYVAPRPPEVVRSRAVETRRVKQHAERVKVDSFMSWLRGESDDKPTAAHEFKFGTQRGFGANRTGLCVCGAEMYAIEYDGEIEMICPIESGPR